MHPDTELEQFCTLSHLPGVAAWRDPGGQLHDENPEGFADWTPLYEARTAAPQATIEGDEFAGAYAAKRASEIVGKQARALRELLATTPQPTTQFEAWAKCHHYDLTRCSHEPYAAYRSDLTNAALAGWRGGRHDEAAQATVQDGAENFACYLIDNCENEIIREESVQVWLGGMLKNPQYARATAPQANHYQQLLGVAYVVLGCLVANGVDIPERFLDAFSDPDSVENPLELLPCDFSPSQAVRAAVEAAALTDEQMAYSEEFPMGDCEQRRFLLRVSEALKLRGTHMLLKSIHEVVCEARAAVPQAGTLTEDQIEEIYEDCHDKWIASKKCINLWHTFARAILAAPKEEPC